jgi:hypothetical protein
MAFDDDQEDGSLPLGVNSKRSAVDFLPKYFRTSTNRKFLNATVDQMISEGTVDKLNVFIGRKNTDAYTSVDRYLEEVSSSREAYQLEPALLSTDTLDNVVFFKDYNDYINQLTAFTGTTVDHSKLNSEEFYSWNPHIDWDKFVNYRDYYWLPSGPEPIAILGQSRDVISEYSVKLSQEGDNIAYIFTPDGLTRNPTITLYRGQTYRFAVDCNEQPIGFKTLRNIDDSTFYTDGIKLFDIDGNPLTDSAGTIVDATYIGNGSIEFTVPDNAPNILYFVSKNDINTSGFFTIYDITDTTEIDVDKEIVGKKTYVTSTGVNLSNGMRLHFQGIVTPSAYANGHWYVEGVGTAITLISESSLETPSAYTANAEIDFDSENFDTQGFDVNSNFPKDKEYIVINRSAKDRNPWSRHNRWFHKSIIESSAATNNQFSSVDQNARAKRPIIEFESKVQLWNFGKIAKANVTVIDTFTTDVFSIIEGSVGYNIDTVDIIPGMRILFTADLDIRVNGRIFKVEQFTHLGIRRLTLIAESDSEPSEGEAVLVASGSVNGGKMYHYTNGEWVASQEKNSLNQSPLFDVVDVTGTSYGNSNKYPGTTFKGTRIFGYKAGTTYDQELGFNIAYRNVGNFGDIVFEFNLHTDVFQFQKDVTSVSMNLDKGYLIGINSLTDTYYDNGWVKANRFSQQMVVKEILVGELRNYFLIDVYDNSGELTDLTAKVYVNHKKQLETDYEIYRQDNRAYIKFFNDLSNNDFLVIKTSSTAIKNNNGYYEFPINLENNPQNLSMDEFTLGEINSHVRSIADSITGFNDTIPGSKSLKDYGNISAYGKKIIQHSSPILISAYHVTSKEHNIIKSLRYAKSEYAKFKRHFLRVATEIDFDGSTRLHLDAVLREATANNTKIMPYYLSDMIPVGASVIYDQTVIDNSITEYPLIFDFDLNTVTEKAVLVYLNDKILLSESDYKFVNNNFVSILTPITAGDNLKVIQYETTDGSYIPPTPTKLGLYPKFEPQIYIDSTYQTPTKVIQGHDGSIIVAFNDYRDDLLLEFETRIFNNIKCQYDTTLFDIYDFISGYERVGDITNAELNSVLVQDFLTWTSLISEDYTKHSFFNNSNSKTFNYSKFSSPKDSALQGFWRGIFIDLYDTDRPHTHPWEMLGFSIRPQWWESQYGPSPYTKDNLILWQDLAEGIIRDPNKPISRNTKFIRPHLLTTIPVDESGNLMSPLDLQLITDYVSSNITGEFVFGDRSPIESAWRRSSEFPFALITALTLLRPARVFATCFDKVRQVRDNTGQIVYKLDDGNLRFNINNLEITNVSSDTNRCFTSGLINYVVDYIIATQSLTAVSVYVSTLSRLVVRLSSKLGGFTTKEKFKLVLDSRSPLNSGNVFVPEENYQIILNTSSPVATVNYSAIIVEKQDAFVIKGYNNLNPLFKYFKPRTIVSDPVVTIGGISESFSEWATEKYYVKDSIISYSGSYYKVIVSHTSASSFEPKYAIKLPGLPITGGREIVIRTRFEETATTLHYGSELKTIQDVVDFLLGHGEYLKSLGFKFENYNSALKTVVDFETSAKEFAFWSTQNWAPGALISLSPLAEQIKFVKEYSVVDDIYDKFYEYSILKQDGVPLNPSFTNSVRDSNEFTLKTQTTADGIYNATLNLVQKEHVLILDNKTIFNDTIYDQQQGYRQPRIKVVGYRTDNWNGDFIIPGFVYDRAFILEWKPWTDFNLADTVKYKEFYYSAKSNVPGTAEFDHNNWIRLENRPTAKLLPNWDYRANEFADFYDLDTNSFDLDQQKFAQHLIGYQKRQYLENIINDDVSQYKFYQGMIQEKGTINSLSKLFDALSTANKDSLEFFEEWAIRLGQYGANAGFNEVEYQLDESKFLINPQPIELVSMIDTNLVDFVYRITQDAVSVAPGNYDHKPFPVKQLGMPYVSVAGYAREEDITYALNRKDEILLTDINTLREGAYFWIGYDVNSWNIYRFTLFASTVKSIELTDGLLRLTLKTNLDFDITIGSYVGINNTVTELEGFYKINRVGLNYFEVAAPEGLTIDSVNLSQFNLNINLYKFISVRIKNTATALSTIDRINDLGIPRKNNGDLVWVDGENNDWAVWKFERSYTPRTVVKRETNFGQIVLVNDANTVMIVSSQQNISYFTRPSAKSTWTFKEQFNYLSTQRTYLDAQNVLTPIDSNLRDVNDSFGSAMAISNDGIYLAVGVPAANLEFSQSGYVSLYTRNSNGFYTFTRIIKSELPRKDELFGSQLKFINNRLVVVAKGSRLVNPFIAVYSVLGVQLDKVEFNIGNTITTISTSDNNIVVGLTDETVKFFTFANTLTLVSTVDASTLTGIYAVGDKSGFGSTVDIDKSGNRIVVGVPAYSKRKLLEGAIIVFEKMHDTFVPREIIKNPFSREGEKFGSNVKFNIKGDQIVVGVAGGQQKTYKAFDGGRTTFDLNSTAFVEVEKAVGSVCLYDIYDGKYIFSDSLDVGNAIGVNYGSSLAITDRVYIGDYADTTGVIHEFSSANKSWYKFRTPNLVVDLDKIKSVFLYNTTTNDIITYLDIVDPLQGKILGIAEQELQFKTHYDPAVYTIGTDEVVVDELMSWQEVNVGKLWWDLSSSKFLDPNQGSILFKANAWNNTFNDESAKVYEWVESNYLPSEWNILADTEEGLTTGISGQSKYGNSIYSFKKIYDNVSKTFKNVYYFWVRARAVTPNLESRKISALDVEKYISDPKSTGISYVMLLGPDQFGLVNCKNLISGTTVAINFRYWIIDNFAESNIHSHYQLLASNTTGKKINKYIEQKWFDSLSGFDMLGNEVPDMRLPEKLKYGVLSRPRQGMFVNRVEALKQFTERVNSVLISRSLIDNYDLSKLNLRDNPPGAESGEYDAEVGSFSELRFIGTNNLEQATLSPIIDAEGRIIRVLITAAGRGYLKAPAVVISGNGTGATITTTIGSFGQLTSATVVMPGAGYNPLFTTIIVRNLTALVTQDETVNNKWALYSWDDVQEQWFRERTQVYDTTQYWEYTDWYEQGYNKFTKLDHLLDFAYQIPYININIGEVVKINNQGAGGWILLEKIDNQATTETTVNFKTVGRQSGTIQFKSNLYKFEVNNVGFDGPTYDNGLFDNQPKEELKIILACIRDDLLINDLEVEYNNLFFASLRYVFSEQSFVDWAFKTSFVRAKHNLGTLEQKPTYQNDNLSSYQEYVNEVKPYRSKIREFSSTFDALDQTRSQVSDFDLPPRYDSSTNSITTFKTNINNGIINYDSLDIELYPYSDWLYNVGSSILSIEIVDSGEGYVTAPILTIEGASADITATAYLSAGRITKVLITDPLTELFNKTPTITISGSIRDGGRQGRLVAILGNSLVRTNRIGVKFDRIAPTYTVNTILVTQTIVGSGSKTKFNLTWPVDVVKTNIEVSDINGDVLGTDYAVYNELDTSVSYTRYRGVIEFEIAPANLNSIVVKYNKDIRLLDAADRIQHFYKPLPGQLGKDLGQLMQGVDYGGVEITGIDFRIGSGWDALPWFTSGWDIFDEDFTDYLVRSNGTTRSYNLQYVPTDIEVINIYVNGSRIDDLNYDIVSVRLDELKILSDQLAAAEIAFNTNQNQYQENSNLVAQLQFDYETKDQEVVDKQEEINAAIPGSVEEATLVAQLGILNSELIAIGNLRTTALADQATNLTNLSIARGVIDSTQLSIATKELEIDALPALTNLNAKMNSFVGNGVATGPIVIPLTVPLAAGDTIIFRKSTSDGSFRPADISYDAQIIGGDFAYQTATGIRPEDINVEGDGFVTAMTSHAPEEVVTGQVIDTVDITVYHKIGDGSPVIETSTYFADGAQTIFSIGQRPGTKHSVIVKFNKQIVDDYTINYENNTIQTSTILAANTEVSIISLSQNGLNILDLDYFVGDGASTEFVSIARWNPAVTAFVTVDGVAADVVTFVTDSMYSVIGNIGIRFATAPAANSIINYTVLGSTVDSISKVDQQTIVYDGITDTYSLTNIPEFSNPVHNSVIVIENGLVLRPPDTVYFTVTGASRTFVLGEADYALNTIDLNAISVTVNGNNIARSIAYQWFSVTNTLRLKRGVANVGDVVAVSINLNADYNVFASPTGYDIKFLNTHTVNSNISVITFANHDILNIERTNNYAESRSLLTLETPEYYRFNQLAGGRFKLRNSVTGSQYVWVTLNRQLLTPEIDYVLETNLSHIRLDHSRVLLPTDIVEVIVFSNKPVQLPVGYKIFKDMLNSTTYSRLDDRVSTVLAEPLHHFNSQIIVEDGSGLQEPNAMLNKPGVIFINGERIEYLQKSGSRLGQLRRGTKGTGAKLLHAAGTLIRDQGTTQLIPYKDEMVTNLAVSNSYLMAAQYFENSNSISARIEINGDDQSLSTDGGDIINIIGTGFAANVVVYIGEPNDQAPVNVTRLDSTQLTVVAPPRSIGEYDLTIVNPEIVVDGIVTQFRTSRVIQSAVKYLKLKVDFIPKTTAHTSWYRSTIPAAYSQSNDIEVFVGGKRLRKAPYSRWNPELGPDSPVGDVNYEAEFSVNGSTYVRLTSVPAAGQTIVVQKRIGLAWAPNGVGLTDSSSDQATFIKLGAAKLPDSYNR